MASKLKNVRFGQLTKVMAKLGYETKRVDDLHVAFVHPARDLFAVVPHAGPSSSVRPIDLLSVRNTLVHQGVIDGEAQFRELFSVRENQHTSGPESAYSRAKFIPLKTAGRKVAKRKFTSLKSGPALKAARRAKTVSHPKTSPPKAGSKRSKTETFSPREISKEMLLAKGILPFDAQEGSHTPSKETANTEKIGRYLKWCMRRNRSATLRSFRAYLKACKSQAGD